MGGHIAVRPPDGGRGGAPRPAGTGVRRGDPCFVTPQCIPLHLLIVKFTALVLDHTDPNQRTANVVLTSQRGQGDFTGQVLLRHPALELETVASMSMGHCHVLLARQAY